MCLGALEFGEIHVDLTIKPEYHRSFGFCQEFAAAGEQFIGNSCAVRGGIALGRTGREFDLDMFLGASYLLPLPVELSIQILYIYNTIPAYTYQTNTLFPFLSLQRKWGGLDLGAAFRFTIFDSASSAIFEPIWGARIFLAVPALDRIKFTVGVSNFSMFSTGNLGAYYLFLKSRIDLNESRPVKKLRERWKKSPRISLINNLELYQTGSIALTSIFQGFAWQGGVSLVW
jgi:hypothetical protein